MRNRIVLLVALAAAGAAVWRGALAWQAPAALPAAQQIDVEGVTVTSQAVGHQYRQDDWPSIASSPDGSLWVAWLSFGGARDDIGIRQYRDGVWRNLLWVPGTSGDSFLPQVAVDSSNRVWVVWSQQVNGNWDIYARRFDPARQHWDGLERLTSDPLQDISRMKSVGFVMKEGVVYSGS